jgi:hypothetical protein
MEKRTRKERQMLDKAALTEAASVYEKYGWTLRRILLTRESLDRFSAEIQAEFPGVEIRDGGLDALWFSRRSRPDSEAWEIRRLSGTPFAILENVPDGTGQDELESILSDAEMRMVDSRWKPDAGM